MTIPAPYFSRTKKDLAESKKEAQRYAPLFNGDIKAIKWPTDKEFCDIRILPPTWNALNPYGPALRLGKDVITQEMFPSSPFFKVFQYYEIGPTKAQFLSSGDMLYEYSGAGSEAAHDLYKKLGGDFIYNYKQRLTDKDEIKLYNAGSKFYAFCIDRRDNSLKLVGISGKLYQSFVLSSVDEDTQEPLPYDAWDNTGFDVRVTLEPGNFDGKSFIKMVGMSIAPATKRKACLPSSEEIVALQQRLYANPIPKLMNFLTSSDMERKLGLSAIGGGNPSNADDEDVSSMTSWGSKTKTETKTKKAAPSEEVSTAAEDEELEDFKVASVSSRKAKLAAKDEDEEEEEEEEVKVAPKSSKGKPPARPAPDADEDEDEAPPVKPTKSNKTAKEMAKSAAKALPDAFEDEDDAPAVEEEEEEEAPAKKAPAKKPTAPTKTGTKQAKMTTAFDDDEDDESPAPAPTKAAKPEPVKAKGAKAQTKLESAFDDDDE